MVPKPHFLLFCDGNSPNVPASRELAAAGLGSASVKGRWRFVLEDLDAGTRLEACDAELVQAPERAALLAVVRGLEALEQPSRVTLVTTSRYVSRGLQFGLTEWRESDYCWEHFGSVQPIRNADLWRRIDHAMQFHQIKCQWIAGESSDAAEDVTQLKVEPILSSTAPEISSSTATKVYPDKALEKGPLHQQDGNNTAAEIVDVLGNAGWRQWMGTLWSAPCRSLRLPSMACCFKNIAKHGWVSKLIAWMPWFFKNSRSSRLAV